MTTQQHKDPKIIDKLIRFCLENKLMVTLLMLQIVN
jgi:hypothetical protein